MFKATQAVDEAKTSRLQEDVDSAQVLVDGLIEGNVKLILTASNAVTKAEISRLEVDVASARVLVAGLPYDKERTPLVKRLDAIVTIEDQQDLEDAEKAAEVDALI